MIHSYFASNFIHRMQYSFIDSLIVLFVCRSEDFCLHPSSDHPERVCYNITCQSTHSGRYRVKLKWIVVPIIFIFEILLCSFIKGEIYSVKERNTEYRNTIAYTNNMNITSYLPLYRPLTPSSFTISFNDSIPYLPWFI